MVDRNFDDIADKFAKNIYGTTKGKIREAVVWQDLTHLISQQFHGQTLRILMQVVVKGIFHANLPH